MVTKPKNIKDGILKHFQKHFQNVKWQKPKLSGLTFNRLSVAESEDLEADFSMNEVWEVIRDCDGNRAPGPDGLNLNFIRKN